MTIKIKSQISHNVPNNSHCINVLKSTLLFTIKHKLRMSKCFTTVIVYIVYILLFFYKGY